VVYVERECQINAELLSDDFDANEFYDQVDDIVHDAEPIIAELPDALTEKLSAFLEGWLKLSGPARDAAAMRLTGMTPKAVALRLGVTEQAISKTLRKAATQFHPLRPLVEPLGKKVLSETRKPPSGSR
jgi:DNA-binding CsgD family transcriptional regulator